jgi:photosystem II stability/assembly factor-like uncharacterized protein
VPAPIRVGRRLVVAAVGPGRLLASGHPDDRSGTPANLGLLISNDEGRSWNPVALLGAADLHLLRTQKGRLDAFDLARNLFVTTTDFGRTWHTHRAPSFMLDLGFDPRSPGRVVASTAMGLLTSRDDGRTWRPLGGEQGSRLAWAGPADLYLIDPTGVVRRSRDGGVTRSVVGELGTEPQAFTAAADGTLYVAGSDHTVKISRDGGATWHTRVRLGP